MQYFLKRYDGRPIYVNTYLPKMDEHLEGISKSI